MNFGKEDEGLEFKESLGELDAGLKSLCAMLNKNGEGRLLFGVSDDGEALLTLVPGKNTKSRISQRIAEICEPSFLHSEQEIPLEDGEHVVIEVRAKGYDRPYNVGGRYYIRNGARDDRADNSLVRSMLLSGKADLLASLSSDDQSLTFEYLRKVLAARDVHFENDPSFFKSHALMGSDGCFNMVAFLLSDQNSFPLKAVVINGVKKGDISSIRCYEEGSLLKGIDKILAYVESLNENKVDMSRGARLETSLFYFEAFREAFINAVVHNSWAQLVPPSVYVYDDRIEVESYGDLPFGLTRKLFFEGRSQPVNPSLFMMFLLAGYSEQSGRGVPYISKRYGEEAFSFANNMVKVTIPFAFTPDAVLGRKQRESDLNNLSPNQQKVRDYLLEHPLASLQEAADYAGISLTSAKNISNKLQEMGLLSRIGSKRDGRWAP